MFEIDPFYDSDKRDILSGKGYKWKKSLKNKTKITFWLHLLAEEIQRYLMVAYQTNFC